MTIPSNFSLSDGYYNIHQIRVRLKDAAGNISSSVSNSIAFTIDTVATDVPNVVFPSSPTNNGTVTVTNASDAVSWAYSVDAGNNWSDWIFGDVSTFTLNHGTYATNDIRVRNRDAAGNISGTKNNESELIIDTVDPENPVVVFPTSPSKLGVVYVLSLIHI